MHSKYYKYLFYSILCFHFSEMVGGTQDDALDNITEVFHRFELVPGVVSAPPNEFVNISYEKMNCTIETTDNAFRDEVETAPKVWWNCNESLYYTLSVLDMNNNRETIKPRFHQNVTWWRERQWHIWLVVNIPGCDINRGETKFEYALGLEQNTLDMHILIFLVYQQPDVTPMKFNVAHRDIYDDRSGFEIEKFANQSNFGPPMAGNFLYFA
ncbi:protein D1-like [Planococcus citri]|uniref:protein D1-like n=1 Tax=Planococcus citri TaxID=170843 RepID=UPI0031F7A806